jgi:hypothetical protein
LSYGTKYKSVLMNHKSQLSWKSLVGRAGLANGDGEKGSDGAADIFLLKLLVVLLNECEVNG